jgi:hypothetical protein
MPYNLVVNVTSSGEEHKGSGRKDIGDNVFVADLPREYPCYAFYYPGPMPDRELEQGLRKLGDQTGHNLFVNIGGLKDPAYGKIAKLFNITRTPVIVLTAVAPLAAPEGTNLNAYVRLDSMNLLASAERTLKCVSEVFTLFLKGEVAKAISKGKWKQRSELLQIVVGCVCTALRSVWDFVSERDISISLFEGRFELKRSGE